MMGSGDIASIAFALTRAQLIKDNGSRGISFRSGRSYHDAEKKALAGEGLES
ncbi:MULTISPECIES: hypothetical protein [Bifidobacterium]|uniref:hypothetical protein n=1 Tax=Bifidobacterium TaxID=1678 RepID=UPI0012B69102|nr:hypothetical protein [Bifidobacterium tibiigranuli]